MYRIWFANAEQGSHSWRRTRRVRSRTAPTARWRGRRSRSRWRSLLPAAGATAGGSCSATSWAAGRRWRAHWPHRWASAAVRCGRLELTSPPPAPASSDRHRRRPRRLAPRRRSAGARAPPWRAHSPRSAGSVRRWLRPSHTRWRSRSGPAQTARETRPPARSAAETPAHARRTARRSPSISRRRPAGSSPLVGVAAVALAVLSVEPSTGQVRAPRRSATCGAASNEGHHAPPPVHNQRAIARLVIDSPRIVSRSRVVSGNLRQTVLARHLPRRRWFERVPVRPDATVARMAPAMVAKVFGTRG